MQSRTPPPTQS